MAYYLFDDHGPPIGPYSREQLVLLRQRGMIPATLKAAENPDLPGRLIDDLLHEPPSTPSSSPAIPPPLTSVDAARGSTPSPSPRPAPPPSASATGDLLRLAPHLMLPLEDFARLGWRDHRRILALALVGLLPLLFMVYLRETSNLAGIFWGVALCTSALWAIFFFLMFSQPEVTVFRCILTFAGSALFSIGLVALARWFIPIETIQEGITSPQIAVRWLTHLFGVALIEEPAKLFMLYFLWSPRTSPRVMMFYGLMSGLGFGIYEGVTYQSSENLRVLVRDESGPAQNAAIYYVLNMLRLTSVPFLHALWTGIAGYFVGFLGRFPARRGGLLLAAILVPALLHATYNTFSHNLIGFVVALFTVVALNVYMLKSQDFERLLTPHSDPDPFPESTS
jgi:RsiW-degrading membrane proteinase PrsW (M82 family)